MVRIAGVSASSRHTAQWYAAPGVLELHTEGGANGSQAYG